MKVSIKGLILAGGTVWALSILVIGILNIISPEYGGEFLRKMATVYPGYKASGKIIDLIVGMLYAFLVGAIWGLILGALYNVFAGKIKKKAAPRRVVAKKKRPAAKRRPAGTGSTGPRLR
jgi:hypothetical protein